MRGLFAYLSRSEKAVFGLVAGVTVCAGFLDSIGLALIIPAVNLIVGTFGSGSAETDFLRWLEQGFAYFGITITLRTVLALMLVLIFARSVFLFAEQWLSAHLQAKFEARLRRQVYSSMFAARWRFISGLESGTVANTVATEAKRAAQALNQTIGVVTGGINLMIYLALGVLVSWQLTALSIAGAAMFLLLFAGLSRVSMFLGSQASGRNMELQRRLNEDMGAAKLIKAHAVEGVAADRFGEIVNRRARLDVWLGVTRGVSVSAAEFAFGGLLIGGLLAATRLLNQPPSSVAIFALIFFRIFQRTKSLQQSVIAYHALAPAVTITKRFISAAYSDRELNGHDQFHKLEGSVRFERVGFRYVRQAPVLRDLNLEIRRGQITAIVGPSGVGKSSIFDLTLGLLQPDEGRVLIDDVPLGQIDMRSWRSRVSYVPQSVTLLSETVAENIRALAPNATMAQVTAAAKSAGADAFIERLPAGYETLVGERGTLLSGGQRQRVALARALIRTPELLILDEATSELDVEAELLFAEALCRMRASTTVLLVAHRMSTVAAADVVYVLEDGSVAESGSPSDLMARGGRFARLHTLQSQLPHNPAAGFPGA